jgi:hypothetical protein
MLICSGTFCRSPQSHFIRSQSYSPTAVLPTRIATCMDSRPTPSGSSTARVSLTMSSGTSRLIRASRTILARRLPNSIAPTRTAAPRTCSKPSKRAIFLRGASVSSKFTIYSCSCITLSHLWPSAFDFNQAYISEPL